MSYCILDIETEGKEYRSRFCDPLEPRNRVVMIQLKAECLSTVHVLYKQGDDLRKYNLNLEGASLLIGHNLKFDLLYLWENPSIKAFLKKGGKIWDTKTVDYLLNACQKNIGYSLNDVAARYGVGQKVNEIGQFYKGTKGTKGVWIQEPMTTMEIIEKQGFDRFVAYAKQDVLLTEKVYLEQYKLVKEYGMEDLIDFHMKYYVSLIATEFNGMRIDYPTACYTQEQYNEILKALLVKINKFSELLSFPVEFNVNSNDHLSLLLFGGDYTTTQEVEVEGEDGNLVYYKSGIKKGQIKVKKMRVIKSYKGLGLRPAGVLKLKKETSYCTDLQTIHHLVESYPEKDILADLLEYKKFNKLNTDLQLKIIGNTNPHTSNLHSEFNTTRTTTGRLSSSNPGSQNLHPSLLHLFISRQQKGLIIELDWSQMEVAVAALIFNESILQSEIIHNVDMHFHNAQILFDKREISPKERKIAKFFTFGILYGQSAYGLSKTHGIAQEVAQHFIDEFYYKYEKIKTAHDRLDHLFNTRYNYNIEGNRKELTLTFKSGKRYFFHSYPKNGEQSFNRSQYKNYIIQGAAADIHAYCVGQFYRDYLQKSDKCTIINNIHDSIILDCYDRDDAEEIGEVAKQMLEGYAKDYTGTNLFKVDIKKGETWADCKG